jgi:hypothetical protein
MYWRGKKGAGGEKESEKNEKTKRNAPGRATNKRRKYLENNLNA